MDTYFYANFCKPGRHDYVVRYTHSDLERDTEMDKGKNARVMPMVLGKVAMGLGMGQKETN